MMKELRTDLMELVVLNGDKNLIKNLEREAEIDYLFADDNGKEIQRRKDESLGAYIERYSVSLMKNFSRKKYEKLKTLCNEYQTVGDSRLVEEIFTINEEVVKQNAFERMSSSIENIIGSLFKNSKKKFV